MSLKDYLGTSSENCVNLPYATMSGTIQKPDKMRNISLKN